MMNKGRFVFALRNNNDNNKNNNNNNNNDQNEGLVCLMPQVHGMHPADERKDTSRDCDKGDK